MRLTPRLGIRALLLAILALGLGQLAAHSLFNSPASGDGARNVFGRSQATSSRSARAFLWRADGSKPLAKEWAEFSTAAHCAVNSAGVTDPSVFQETSVLPPYAPTGRAYQFTAAANEAPCYGGTRAELGEALPARGDPSIGSGGFSSSRYFLPGRGYWVSFWTRLGRNFGVNANSWDNVAQFKTPNGSSAEYPTMLLQVYDRRWWWVDANANKSYLLGRAVSSRWMQLTLHFVVSSDPHAGYVEVFGSLNGGPQRRLLARRYMATTATCAESCSSLGLAEGSAMPVAARIGIYRSRLIPGSATDYFAGYTVATTRQAAQDGAFGSPNKLRR